MKHLKNVGLGVAGVLLVAMGLTVAGVGPAFGTEKITICHVAGQEGSTQFVTLNLPYQAVFGQGGHFNENGTPQAGHEQDYMGPCQNTPTETETTPTETDPPPTTTPTPTPTPTPMPTPPAPECPNNPGGVPPNPPGGQDGKPGNDRCVPDPTTPSPTTPTATVPTATAPQATTPTPPPPTTSTSSKPPVTQPLAKPKPKKPKPKTDDPVEEHVCKALKDGTERRWFKGGNGLKPGCYPIARGSY